MSSKKFLYGMVALVCVCFGSAANAAWITVTDNFDTDHNYLPNNVAGTIWHGMQYGGSANVSVANSNIANAGRLTIASNETRWENAQNSGFLLYRNVSGDFVATVQVTAFGFFDYHDMGLMARSANPVDNGNPGEDWVAGRHFTASAAANRYVRLRSTNNGASVNPAMTPADMSGINASLRPFLKLERVGDLFTFTAANDAAFTTNVTTSSVLRTDLVGLPMQVGIWHATFSATTGTAQFDNFSLSFVPEPSTATLGVLGVVFGALMRRRRRG